MTAEQNQKLNNPALPARYTVTAALPYANGPVHIGHLAGCYLPADSYARYLRMRGRDVIFICGSDEHGVAITLKARQEGVTPQQLVDKYDAIIRNSFEKFGISTDIYSRTSRPIHHETAADFFKTLYDKGVFEQKTTLQYFDEKIGQFLADRYITGTCPHCGNERAYGDQCEKCGTSLDPQELIDPRSTETGETPVLKETTHWYLPLQNYQAYLEKYVLENHTEWKPHVLGQCRSWLEAGLQARSITRDMEWGVKVPVEGAEGKVLYVWMDAPIGYITATRELAQERGFNWEDYWKKEDTRLVHFIGKDNIVFHCLIFPAMLHAHGGYIAPDNVPANEFLNIAGQKVSTSRGWAVWLHEYLQDFPGKEDTLRYVLTSIAPESKDSDFTWPDFQQRANSELAAILGNLVNRLVVLTHKFYNGIVPPRGNMLPEDEELAAIIAATPEKVANAIEAFRFRDGLTEAMNLARAGNKYLTDMEPWKTVKTDSERAATVMHLGLQLMASLSLVLEPFLPFTAAKMRNALHIRTMEWEDAGKTNLLREGQGVEELPILFEKIEDPAIALQIARMEERSAAMAAPAPPQAEDAPQSAPETAPPAIKVISDTILFPDFEKIDLRVGTIEAAARVPKADKLLHLIVNIGLEKRDILSGIAEHFTPEEIVGRQVVVVVNLAPRKMRGVESRGMILMAEDEKGKLVFVSPDALIPPGSVVR